MLTIQQYVNGQWLDVKRDVPPTVRDLGIVLVFMRQPGAPWRAVRSDGEVFRP